MPYRREHCTLAEDMLSGEIVPRALSFPDIGERRFWDGITPEYRVAQIRTGEEAAAEPWAQLLASDYLCFSESGEREGFERKYFSRRQKLTTLVLSECMENRGRFLSPILDGLYLLLEETGWCLPAHNSYVRDEKQYPLQDAAHPVIDLFAAETAAIIGVAEQLLRPRLREISPFISELVSQRIRERILHPYRSYHFWWMGDGKSPMLNWTPWITQNVLLALFTRERLEAGEAELRQAALSLDFFLDEYGDDGCCSEGAEYYGHAGLCLYGALRLLCRILGDASMPVFHSPLLYQIGNYIRNVYVGFGRYFNFADCSPHAGSRTARDFLFARATGNESYARFAAEDYRRSGFEPSGEDRNGRLLCNEENLYYHLLQLSSEREMLEYAPESAEPPTDCFYESVGLFLTRDARYTLAVKAGNNADAHNHNDCGSVTLYRDGKPLLIDIGVETYTRKTFSPERYQIWTMQSKYHNLPSFYLREEDAGISAPEEREIQQRAGAEFAAREVEWQLGDAESRIAMELAGAYGSPLVQSYRRSVSFRKGEGICLRDHYRGSAECRLTLMFCTEPELLPGAKEDAWEIQVGDAAFICQGVSRIEKERLPIRDARLRREWKQDCWRLLLTMRGEGIELWFPE